MNYGLIIGGLLGFIISGGNLYFAVFGAALGYFFSRSLRMFSGSKPRPYIIDPGNAYSQVFRERDYLAPHDFFSSLMVLTAYVVDADGRIMHSEMEHVRTFLRNNFGERGLREGEPTRPTELCVHPQPNDARRLSATRRFPHRHRSC